MQKRKDTNNKDDEQRIRKTRKDKRPDDIPKFKVGERVVLKKSYNSNSKYILVKVVDIVHDRRRNFKYYGKVIKVSHYKLTYMVDHLADFSESCLWGSHMCAKVPEDSIRWVVEKEETNR